MYPPVSDIMVQILLGGVCLHNGKDVSSRLPLPVVISESMQFHPIALAMHPPKLQKEAFCHSNPVTDDIILTVQIELQPLRMHSL